MRLFTLYIPSEQKVSEPLMNLLEFVDFAGYHVKEFDNSAILDDHIRALEDLGYKWFVQYTFDDPFDNGVKVFNNITEWSKWYND